MYEFISLLQKDNLLLQIHLNRFSKEDMNEIISSTLGSNDFDQTTLDAIYEETAGNAFFLNELLTSYKGLGAISDLSFNAQNILVERLNGLSLEAKQIMDIMSMFHDYTTLDLLESMLGRNSLEILDSIEELKIRSLIKERLNNGMIQFYFTHNKMREFVHSKISPSKQKILHSSIGYALERTLSKSEPSYYTQLVYHFSLGGNATKVLMYQIYPFEDISITMFELYPSLFYSLDSIETENISEYFITLENNLEQIHGEFNDENLYQDLYARLIIAKGRFYILSGLYCEGLISIKKSFQLPYVQNNPNYMLKSLRQMVYYSIQLYQVDLMKEYVEKGLELARECDALLELALFQRLNGLRYLMLNRFEECNVFLQQSISLLETHNIQNSTSIINIAAAYNYLGEMERKQKHFDQAIAFYKQAISLCTEYNASINSTFYTNLGCAYLGKGQKLEAYDSFFVASDLYDNSFTLMGRSITKGYCTIYYCEKGDFEKAKKFLIAAENAVKQLGSPSEKGLFRRTQAEISFRFPTKLQDILTERIEFYCEDCERLLKPLDLYEVEDISNYLMKIN
jgi:tetratricopeptide (TPR) repeat protein